MEKKGEIKKRGRTYCVAGAPNNVMPRYVEQFPHTKYVLFIIDLLTLSKTPFHPKFHTFAVKIGQNKNKIGDIKITKDSLRKLDLHLER